MWFKCDDRLPSSRKAAKAGVAAMGLWVLAGCWSAGEELDGFVPTYMVERLAGATGASLAGSLVDAGLWLDAEMDGEAGYRFHAWDEYQPTREQLEAKREAARERMRGVRANGERTSQSVRPTPTRPDPTKKNTSARKLAEPEGFAAFWDSYPRKVGRGVAAKAFAKAIQQIPDESAIRDGLQNALQVWKATGTEPQFIPHPATWLNQGRWADEVALPGMPTAPTRTHRQCTNYEPHPRHPWADGNRPHMCLGADEAGNYAPAGATA